MQWLGDTKIELEAKLVHMQDEAHNQANRIIQYQQQA